MLHLRKKIILGMYGLLAAGLLLPLAAQAQLSVSKTILGKQTVAAGEKAVFQIVVTNSAESPITEMSFTDVLPRASASKKVQFVGATGECTAGGDPGSWAASTEAQFAVSGATVAARTSSSSTCTYQLTVTANAAYAAAENVLDVGAVTGLLNGKEVANVEAARQTVDFTDSIAPVLGKSFSPSRVPNTRETKLTITLRNPSKEQALEVTSLQDRLPAGLKVASEPKATLNCGSGTSTLNLANIQAGGSVVHIGSGRIEPNGSCSVSLQVVANADLSESELQRPLINAIEPTDLQSNSLLPAKRAQATLTVTTPFIVSKHFNPVNVVAGVPATLLLDFKNEGVVPLTLGAFADYIDGVKQNSAANMEISNVAIGPNSAATCAFSELTGANNLVQFNGATLPAQSVCSIQVTYLPKMATAVPAGKTFTNVIDANQVSAQSPNGEKLGHDKAANSVTIRDTYTVEKKRSTEQVAQGSLIQYTIKVKSWRQEASRVTVTDELESRLSYFSAGDFKTEITGNACSIASQPSHKTAGKISFAVNVPGNKTTTGGTHSTSCTLKFWAKVADDADLTKGPIENKIDAADVCSANDVCAGAGSNTTFVDVVSPLSVVKTFDAQQKLAGDPAVVTLTLQNISDKEVTELSLTDVLPTRKTGGAVLQFAQPVQFSSTCGGTPAFTQGDAPTFTLTGAKVPPRLRPGSGNAGSCQISFRVLGDIGQYTNVIKKDQVSAKVETYDGGIKPIIARGDTQADIKFNDVLSGAKSFSPTEVQIGGRSTVTIRLNNSKDSDLTGVAITDALPKGMVVANPAQAYSTCAANPSIVANAGESTVKMTGARIAANGNCALVFDVVVNEAGPWRNDIKVGDVTADGNVKNSSSFGATLLNSDDGGLAVTMGHAVASLMAPGEVTQLDITLTNNTNKPLTGVALETFFRENGLLTGATTGEQIAPAPNVKTTCDGAVITAQPNATSFALAGVGLGAGKSCTVTLDVTLARSATSVVSIPEGGVTSDQGVKNKEPARTTLSTDNTLGLAKQFTPAVIKVGETSRLKITVYNALLFPVSDLSVVDVFPAGMVIADNPDVVSTCSGTSTPTPSSTDPGSIKLTGGAIVAGTKELPATCTIEVNVTLKSAGEYDNVMPKAAGKGVSNGTEVETQKEVKARLTAREPIEIHKAFTQKTQDQSVDSAFAFTQGVATQAAGTPFELSIALKNPNTIAVTGITLHDTLPEGLTLAQEPSLVTCSTATFNIKASPFGRDIWFTDGQMPAGALCKVTVKVVSNSAGSYVNQIGRNAITSTEGITNTSATSAKVVITTPPTISKEFDPPVISAGATSKLTIRINNPNDAEMQLTANLVDKLPTVPGPVTVASTGLDQGLTTCKSPVTATPGTGSITLASGAKVPAGGCVIVVDVTAQKAGVHTNEIAREALQTNMGKNPDPANATLTVSSKGFISGRVFVDNDQNGQFTAGDEALAGSVISLHKGNSCTGDLVVFTNGEVNPQNTNAAGNYLFSELDAGSYSICQSGQPAGTLNALPVAGTAAGNPSNPTSGNYSSQITNVQLATQQDGTVQTSTGNNFPEVKPVSISGSVFVDLNNDGKRDATDNGLSGVKVVVTGTDFLGQKVSKEVLTDNSGNYSFADLPPGTYTVTEPEQPQGTTNGITTQGTAGGTPTPVTKVPSAISQIELKSGAVATDYNFAELPLNGTISGRVFLDHNDNGTPDAGDAGIANVVIRLEGVDVNQQPLDPVEVTTDSGGNFVFLDLPAGEYKLVQVNGQPTGTLSGKTTAGTLGGVPTDPSVAISTISQIKLGIQGISVNNYFAEIPAPDLVIAKTHQPQQFMAAGKGQYTLVVGNIGLGKTNGRITVVDTLPQGLKAAGTPVGSGWSCSVANQVITCMSDLEIPANTALADAFTTISIPVLVDGGLGETTLLNIATVEGGGEPQEHTSNNRAEDPTPISRSLAKLSGSVWLDSNHDRRLDPAEALQAGWTVELVRDGAVIATTLTGANGKYVFTDVVPERGYEVRFRHPETGVIFGRAVPNEAALSFSDGVVDPLANPAGASTEKGTLTGLTLEAGSDIAQQSLPLDPGGVVYDALTRQPVKGAQVSIEGPSGFDASYVVGGSLTQTTGTDGWYQFMLTPNAPAGQYRFVVTVPAGYIPGQSEMIPACQSTLSVGAQPSPAAVQAQAGAPSTNSELHTPANCASSSAGLSTGQNTTQYYMSFTVGNGSANLVNNHIPIDPVLGGAIVMTKMTPKVNVTRGELVPYTLTARNTLSSRLSGIAIEDQIPAGFQYVRGSAQMDGIPLEPEIQGRLLRWPSRTFNPNQTITVKLVLVVGSGVGFNEYVNQTWSRNVVADALVSNIATAAVRVVADPTFDCSDLIGTVFDDKNRNGYQDEGEPGIAGVRLATAKGWLVTTDEHGRYHIACADVPSELRGSNFIIKVDERTLPSGYRVVTENPRVVRMTQGRLTKANFGASIHRVVRLDLTAQAFTPEDKLTPEYLPRLDDVLVALQAEPSILRISYHQPFGSESETARKRVAFVRDWIKAQWQPNECCYDLQLEEEIIPVTETVEVVK